jgi:hypothetical protein
MDSIDSLNSALVGIVSMVIGISGTVLAFLKLKPEAGSETKAPPASEVGAALVSQLSELKASISALTQTVGDVQRYQKDIYRRVDTLATSYVDHERLVSELHSGLLSPEKEVERRLMVKDIRASAAQVQKLEDDLRQHVHDAASMVKGIALISESVDIMARKLKELSQ